MRQFKGEIFNCQIAEDKACIKISGCLYDEWDAMLCVYRLPVYARVEKRKKGIPLILKPATTQFSLAIPTSNLQPFDEAVEAQYLVCLQWQDGTEEPIAPPRYVENPEILSLCDEPYPVVESIKGVGVLMNSDVERLQICNTCINVVLNTLLADKGEDDALPFMWRGQVYQISKKFLHLLDARIRTLTANGILVKLILLVGKYAYGRNDPSGWLIHPDFIPEQALIPAANLTDMRGTSCYGALISFLAQRYSRSDMRYGRVWGYIVGNEISAASVWNNMGDKPLDEYLRQYMCQLRLTHTLVRQALSTARVFVSSESRWCSVTEIPTAYSPKEILDGLIQLSHEEGDFDWGVAWHPYPENLFDPRPWRDPHATETLDTQFITLRNLHLLPEYLSAPQRMCRGKRRSVILSEQGFTSGDHSPFAQRLQAAAFAYGYYKSMLTDGIDGFNMNRHVDHADEGGLNLGLWTTMPGKASLPHKRKWFYDLFRTIDTPLGLENSQFALDVIGEDLGKELHSWADIIPEFDEQKVRKLCCRAVDESIAVNVSDTPPADATALKGCFQATDNTESLSQNGDQWTAMVNSPNEREYQGLTWKLTEITDMMMTPKLYVRLRAQAHTFSDEFVVLIRVYGENAIAEGQCRADAADVMLCADLSTFSAVRAVKMIKIWARPLHAENKWQSGQITVYTLRAGK